MNLEAITHLWNYRPRKFRSDAFLFWSRGPDSYRKNDRKRAVVWPWLVLQLSTVLALTQLGIRQSDWRRAGIRSTNFHIVVESDASTWQARNAPQMFPPDMPSTVSTSHAPQLYPSGMSISCSHMSYPPPPPSRCSHLACLSNIPTWHAPQSFLPGIPPPGKCLRCFHLECPSYVATMHAPQLFLPVMPLSCTDLVCVSDLSTWYDPQMFPPCITLRCPYMACTQKFSHGMPHSCSHLTYPQLFPFSMPLSCSQFTCPTAALAIITWYAYQLFPPGTPLSCCTQLACLSAVLTWHAYQLTWHPPTHPSPMCPPVMALNYSHLACLSASSIQHAP